MNILSVTEALSEVEVSKPPSRIQQENLRVRNCFNTKTQTTKAVIYSQLQYQYHQMLQRHAYDF
jgi:hypothetical protein